MNKIIEFICKASFDEKIDHSELVDYLQHLLKLEYLQRDVYESYRYVLFGIEGLPLMEHFDEHMLEEMNHIDKLQMYITGLGSIPTVERYKIPEPKDYTTYSLLKLNEKLEMDAVEAYTIAINAISKMEGQNIALINDLEEIVSQEQEHVFDIKRWLNV